MKTKLFTAIFVTGKDSQSEKWYKYKKISNNEKSIKKFIDFAKNKGANEINLYDSETRLFCEKIVILDR